MLLILACGDIYTKVLELIAKRGPLRAFGEYWALFDKQQREVKALI